MNWKEKKNWKVREQGDADQYCVITQDGRWVIAFQTNGELHLQECREIACLVSAAPDMLKILEDIMGLSEGSNDMTNGEKQQMAMNAIRKARGDK